MNDISQNTRISVFLWMLFGLLQVSIAYAAPVKETYFPVVATTSWTAAFAKEAGIDSVHVLAPFEMRHPSEYVLKPSDIKTVAEAKYIVYAGYEKMVKKILASTGENGPTVIQINTDYRLSTIRESLLKIAEKIGTLSAAEERFKKIERFFGEWKDELVRSKLDGAPVVVHVFQRPLAEELGFTVKGVFGPAPLEARQFAQLSESAAVFVIDNSHNEVGKPLIEVIKSAEYVSFMNFPGSHNTKTLLDVLRYNRMQIGE